jgi:CRP/FNR family transcriptional regulator, polysaccharide utilization system transcription regulator
MEYTNPYIELCLEGSSSIFKGLNKKDKETLIIQHKLSITKKGQFLFKEGDKPHGLICLASGKAKVFKDGVGGRGQILKMVRQNGFIGYKTLFSDNPWAFSAIAIEDTAICIFNRNALIRILKKNPDLSLKFIKLIADELWISNNRTVSLTQKHIRGRLAESLLILRDTYGFEADGRTIKISMSREDIASLSNMTTSNAIRTLSNLAADGIIEIAGRRISIIDGIQLEHICELG